MSVLTVVTFLWRGWRPLYDHTHVNALQRMLADHLSLPHRLVCVTDMPQGIECEVEPLWDHPDVKVRDRYPNCYKRLFLFSEEAKAMFGERILAIDLDCVIFRDLAPLITDDDFKIVRGIQAPYNGSMWLHRTGTRTQVWDTFDPLTSPELAGRQRQPNGRRYLGSDQAWLSHVLPGAPTWRTADGVYLFYADVKNEPLPETARIVFFPGHRKPWDPHMQQYLQIYEQYGKYLRG